MKEKITIPGESQEFGMESVGEVKKYKPNVVKEVEDLGNAVSID